MVILTLFLEETCSCHIGYSFMIGTEAARDLLFTLPIDRIAQTMAFVEPVMDHLLVQVVYTYPLSLAEHSLRV